MVENGRNMTEKNKNKKFGFSLFEALVSMLILSIFFLASTKVITQKQKTEVQRNPHGYYECYIVNGAMWHRRVVGSSASAAVRTNTCTFVPPSGITFVNLHCFDGERYYNGQQLIMNDTLNLGSPLQFYNENTQGAFNDTDQNPTPAQKIEAVNEFKTYLKISHPDSRLYKIWTEQHIQPTAAMMVAW